MSTFFVHRSDTKLLNFSIRRFSHIAFSLAPTNAPTTQSVLTSVSVLRMTATSVFALMEWLCKTASACVQAVSRLTPTPLVHASLTVALLINLPAIVAFAFQNSGSAMATMIVATILMKTIVTKSSVSRTLSLATARSAFRGTGSAIWTGIAKTERTR